MKTPWIGWTVLMVSSFAGASQTLSLEQYLSLVKGQSLELKASQQEWKAAKGNASGIQLPPPMVGLTQMTDPTGRSNGYEVSQTIPFPTKLTSDQSARDYQAKAKAAYFKNAEVETTAEARLTYFKLWEAQERIRLLKEKKSAIVEHLKLSTASARSDSFLRIHIVKTEGDLDLLENEILEAEQSVLERSVKAAVLASQNPNTFRPQVLEIPMTPLLDLSPKATSFRIQAQTLEVKSLKSRESEALSFWLPDFGVRYREVGATPMTPKSSEIMVTATLPFLFFWEPSGMNSKASAEKLRGEYLLAQEKIKFDSAKTVLLAKATNLKKQIGIIKTNFLSNTEKRQRLIRNIAPRDLETLQEHRETMESSADFKLRELALRSQYEETLAELEKLKGEEAHED